MASPTLLHPNAAQSLALAMVACSEAPLLLLDEKLTVVAASTSFCRSFQIDSDSVANLPIFEVGAGEWNSNRLRSLLEATLSGVDIESYEMDLKRNGHEPRRLVLHARKLELSPSDNARVLVTVSDVTDARLAEKLKDDLLRERNILLQEVQHRVANSLQIIASVLLQSARKVQSEETRLHLSDAHNRVMSIATVQKQLATSRAGDVALGPYFTQLCQSLGASMIGDHDQLSIEVNTDKSEVKADISISLGLIVTELVINALKHAFPGGGHGKITVGYQSQGLNWALVVGDNGVGMRTGAIVATPGLGTSIVEALAKQLRARVRVANAKPGTEVSIIHSQIAAVENQPAEVAI